MSAEDHLAFIKEIKAALVEQRQGTKRGREPEDKGNAQKTDGRPLEAKKPKRSNFVDTIKAINDIYSEQSKIPEAVKHMLASQVCQSSGWTVDPSVFASSPQQAPVDQPIAQPDGASSNQEQVVSPPVFPVEGQQAIGQPVAQPAGQQPVAQPAGQQPIGQPAGQPAAAQSAAFNLSSFSAQEKRDALNTVFASRRQASDPSASSN